MISIKHLKNMRRVVDRRKDMERFIELGSVLAVLVANSDKISIEIQDVARKLFEAREKICR